MSSGFRRFHLHGYARDAALAAGVAAIVVANALLGAAGTGGLALLDYLYPLAAAAVLVARRRAPRLVLVLALAWLGGYGIIVGGGPGQSSGMPAIPALPALVALFTAVKAGHGRFAAAVVIPVVALSVPAALLEGAGPTGEVLQERFLAVGWFVAAAVMGEAYRQWSAYTAEVERRLAEAERTREEAALRRASEERLRIARELHDSLTHAISIIKVQAGVAVHLARKRGEEVPEALQAIQEASGAATRELRSTLEVLRQPSPDGDASDTPVGLAQLAQLAQGAGSAGRSVSVSVTGERPEVPAAVDRAAYRIVQEALTNITRHAGDGAAAAVRVDYGGGTVSVLVTDDGQADPDAPPVPGTGLLGMRERVAALGGTLAAEPRPEGGFRVRAELPLREPAEAPAGGGA